METEIKAEGRPHPKGPDEPKLQTVRPGEICQVVQFFRKSWELDFSTKSLVFSILVLLCFKHRTSQKKHSLDPVTCGTSRGPQTSWYSELDHS